MPRFLLAHDRALLDRLALLLGDAHPSLALVACDPSMRSEARAQLTRKAGLPVPAPIELSTPEQVVDLLGEAACATSGVALQLSVPVGRGDLVEAINWQREKLRAGAPVVLWLEGVAGLREFREQAPDAYSFRDVAVVLEGEEPFAPTVVSETPKVRKARRDFEQAQTILEKSNAAVGLAQELVKEGAFREARGVAHDAHRKLSKTRFTSPETRTTRAHLLHMLARETEARERTAETWELQQRALRELEGVASPRALDAAAFITAALVHPLGHSAPHVDLALARPRGQPSDLNVTSQLLRSAADVARQRGRFRKAEELLVAARDQPGLDEYSRGLASTDLADLSRMRGDFPAAAEEALRALDLFRKNGTYTPWAFEALARLRIDRSERESADRLLTPLLEGHVRVAEAGLLEASLRLSAGEWRQAILGVVARLQAATATGSDGAIFSLANGLIDLLQEAHRATPAVCDVFAPVEAALDVAQDAALSAAGDDLPWYRVLFPELRARLLALQPARLDEAMKLAAQSVFVARREWNEVLPRQLERQGRLLVEHDGCEAALPILDEAMGTARARGDLRIEISAAGALVAAFSRLGRGNEARQTELHLESLLREADAPRLLAETFLTVARLVASSDAMHDVLPSLEQAQRLFLEMPMPNEESECLELLGDMLAGRGRTADARGRYLLARRRRETYGLRLTLPRVEKKLAALTS